jgi:hypothetical protein
MRRANGTSLFAAGTDGSGHSNPVAPNEGATASEEIRTALVYQKMLNTKAAPHSPS